MEGDTTDAATSDVTTLSLTEAYCLAFAASQVRGFPDNVADGIAARILWLERRGLPGLIAMTREYINNHETSVLDRGLQCPLLGGAMLGERLDDLVAVDPRQPHVIDGPTNGVLLLPVIAQYAAKIGEPIRVSWVMNDPPEIVSQTVVDADSVLSVGDPAGQLLNTGVGFARHGMPMQDGVGPQFTASELPTEIFGPLINFIGRDLLDAAIAVHNVLSSDEETLALLSGMSAEDRAILESGLNQETDADVLLTTAPGSSNDALWERFSGYGWTEAPQQELPEAQHGVIAQYALTNAGRLALPLLLRAPARFPAAER